VSYESTLESLVLERPGVVVMTAENRAHIRNLPARLGPRFIDVGIAEQTLVGMAAGLALRGRTPVVHALAPFLTMRAFEFIRTDVALAGLSVKLVGMIGGLLSDGNGPTHQALEDVALMRAIPGMHVFCPADEEELERGLPTVLDCRGPCYVRYTAQTRTLPPITEVSFGSAEVLAKGRDVTLLSYGLLSAEAFRARELLEACGVSTGVINVRWLSPLDEDAVLEAAESSAELVTIEDHFLVGGLYSAVVELLSRRRVNRVVTPFGFDARWFGPGRLPAVLAEEGLSATRIAERLMEHRRNS
jgi:transketolase